MVVSQKKRSSEYKGKEYPEFYQLLCGLAEADRSGE